MATKTVRKTTNVVKLTPSNKDFLEYSLSVKGARANFAWADEHGTVVLTHQDFGLQDVVTWRLQSEPAPGGKVKLTVPENPSYARIENAGAAPMYQLTLAFVTATDYTLTVLHCNGDGTDIDTPTDVDYKMKTQGETVPDGLFVGV